MNDSSPPLACSLTVNELPRDSLVRRAQRGLEQALGFTLPLAVGTWGIAPYPVRLDVVVGQPLRVPKFEGEARGVRGAPRQCTHARARLTPPPHMHAQATCTLLCSRQWWTSTMGRCVRAVHAVWAWACDAQTPTPTRP